MSSEASEHRSGGPGPTFHSMPGSLLLLSCLSLGHILERGPPGHTEPCTGSSRLALMLSVLPSPRPSLPSGHLSCQHTVRSCGLRPWHFPALLEKFSQLPVL